MVIDWSQAQAAVIGSALIDAACVPLILSEMRPEDFSGPFLTVFRTLQNLSREQTLIDPVVILARVGSDYEPLFHDLMDRTPTAANVKSYIRICKEQSRLRAVRELGEKLAEAGTLEDARETIQKAAAATMEVAANTTYTAAEMAADWINSVNAQEKPDYITTGIGCLDSTVHTVKGNYHVIGGFTGFGKSTLAIQIAWHMAQTRRVGYFSNEVTRQELLDRLMTSVSGVDAESVKTRDLNDDAMTATGRAAGQLFKAQLAREEAAGMTVDDIRAKTLEKGYEVIFVDYLQNVMPPRQNYDRFRGVAEISRGFQAMAHTLGVVVIAMSQLTDQISDDEFIPTPTLSTLRESRQIGMDADAVIFVHEPLQRRYPRFCVLDVAKNRSGKQDRFFLAFDAPRQRFLPPTPEETRIWKEIMHKRRALKAEELAEIKAEMEAQRQAAQMRTMANEQKKRHQKKYSGEQMAMEEVAR